MMIRFLPALALCLALPTFGQARMADISCDDSARMTARLTERLGAERQGMGLRDPETMLEVWVERRTGDWLIVQSYSNGTSCIIAMGEFWEGDLAGPV
ncbi:hypothetical protein [Pacificoceanicola onchidii]|uniref:hypothetical protein n=1 Tax=Pacificoceanicola onchidii TaxID=2562685 RepID=UPI0010A5064F|nr:hypothetical protein [Pacificoceanicola onchidii]